MSKLLESSTKLFADIVKFKVLLVELSDMFQFSRFTEELPLLYSSIHSFVELTGAAKNSFIKTSPETKLEIDIVNTVKTSTNSTLACDLFNFCPPT